MSPRFRRLTFAAALVVLLELTLGQAGLAATTAADWKQTDVGAARSRNNRTETILTKANVGSVVPLRSFLALPQPAQHTDECGGWWDAPAVVDHRMFVVRTGWLYGYDISTGKQLWRVQLDPTLDLWYVNVAVAGSMVLVAGYDTCGTETAGDSFVDAYNISTGAHLYGIGLDQIVNTMLVSG